MHFILTTSFVALLISGIKTEAEPLSGSLGVPLTGSGSYKDGHHEYLQAFHHGQHHGISGSADTGVSSGVGHAIINPQIQDQASAVASQDQVPHSAIGGGQFVGSPAVGGGSVIPQVGVPIVPSKSEVPLHFGARAIGSPLPYYPFYGKTYASPYYNPYHGGVYQQPYQQYSGSPYSAVPYSASPYSATPYSSPVTPYSGYPYNFGYYPQFFPSYPAGSYYQSSGEIQSVNKQ